MKAAATRTEREIEKAIERGDFADCYLVYNRRSLDEPESQVNSLDYQTAENTKLVRRSGIKVATLTLSGFARNGYVNESHSAFKEDDELVVTKEGRVSYRIERPKFQRILYYLHRRYFKGLAVLSWDRASRNKGDDKVIRYLMKKGVDFRFALTTYDQSSSGEFHKDMDGAFAQHHSRVTSEKVTLSAERAREKGLCTYRAPVGYLNQGTMEHKPFDPERIDIVREVPVKFLAEDWSLSGLARWANDQSFTMPPVRRKRTKEELAADEEIEIEPACRPADANAIHRILTNPFYAGYIKSKTGLRRSTCHTPIISWEQFQRIQAKLASRRRSKRYPAALPYPHRGLMRCGGCSRVYTPYVKKGIFYFSSRCRAGCRNNNRNVNITFLEKRIGDVLAALHFTDEQLEELDASGDGEIAALEAKWRRAQAERERSRKKIREDLAYLDENRVSLLRAGVYSPEGYAKEERKLSAKLYSLQESEQAEEHPREAVDEAVRLSELLKRTHRYYVLANSTERERIIEIVFSELALFGEILTYKCNSAFQILERSNSSLGAPDVWLSELIDNASDIKRAIAQLDGLRGAPTKHGDTGQ